MRRLCYLTNIALCAAALWQLGSIAAVAGPLCHDPYAAACPTGCTVGGPIGTWFPCCYNLAANECCQYSCRNHSCTGNGCPDLANPPEQCCLSGPDFPTACSYGGNCS